jgi:replicative DNA helicase
MLSSLAIEQEVIGNIILNGDNLGIQDSMDRLTVSDFFELNHKKAFQFYKARIESGLGAGIQSVMDLPKDIEGPYFWELTKNTMPRDEIDNHVDELKRFTSLRTTEQRLKESLEVLYSNASPQDRKSAIEALSVIDEEAAGKAKHISEALSSFVEDLNKRWFDPESVITPTGIEDLDKILGGGFENDLYCIAAVAKCGKTELALKIASHISKTKPVLFHSLEMQDFQVMMRMVSNETGQDKTLIKNNFATLDDTSLDYDLEQKTLFRGVEELNERNFYVDDRFNISPSDVKEQARYVKKKEGSVGAIFVDYLTLMQSDGNEAQNHLKVMGLARALKGMTKMFNCPVIILAQPNRSLAGREDKRLQPTDLRDAAIENDIAALISLYRDSMYNDDSPYQNITEVIVSNHRHGENGTCYQTMTSRGFANCHEDNVANIVHREEVRKQDAEQSKRDQQQSGRKYGKSKLDL